MKETETVAARAVKQALEAALAAMRARNLEYCCPDPCTCESSRDAQLKRIAVQEAELTSAYATLQVYLERFDQLTAELRQRKS